MLRARSHCASFSDCDCNLFLFVMGCIGVGDVVAVIVCTLPLSPVQPICCDKKNRSRNLKKKTV